MNKLPGILSKHQFKDIDGKKVLYLTNPLDADYEGVGKIGDVLEGSTGSNRMIGVEDSDGHLIAHPPEIGPGQHEKAEFSGNLAIWRGWGMKAYYARIG